MAIQGKRYHTKLVPTRRVLDSSDHLFPQTPRTDDGYFHMEFKQKMQ